MNSFFDEDIYSIRTPNCPSCLHQLTLQDNAPDGGWTYSRCLPEGGQKEDEKRSSF